MAQVDRLPTGLGDTFPQVHVFAWGAMAEGWETVPVPVSDQVVSVKGMLWQHNLTLLAVEKSSRAQGWRTSMPMLPEGGFLLKAYLDFMGKLVREWKVALGGDDFVAQVEFAAKWRQGYGAMPVVGAADVRP